MSGKQGVVGENQWLGTWRADARLVIGAMHPQAREDFRKKGPWWTVGRSLFAKVGRRAGVPIEYMAFMFERMDVEGEVP